MTEQRTFSIPEVAEITGCCEETIRRHIRNDNLNAARPGKGYQVSRPELQRWWRDQGGGDLFNDDEGDSDATE